MDLTKQEQREVVVNRSMRVTKCVTLPVNIVMKLNKYCSKTSIPASAIIAEALDEYLGGEEQ